MKRVKLAMLMVAGFVSCTNAVHATPIEEVVQEKSEISQVENKIVTLTTQTDTKLRTAAQADAEILVLLPVGTQVVVKQKVDNWYEVAVNDLQGYIYKTQLNETGLENVPVAAPKETYLGEKVVAYAKLFLGYPYRYGGNNLKTGVDCSGFTTQVYKNFGINLQRSSTSQYTSNGYKVAEADLLPGDLVFYGYKGVINHVALYAGDGKIVHSSTPATGIIMSNLRYGTQQIIGFKRVI
jgi:cell wall-associated NlpC family hydrolase